MVRPHAILHHATVSRVTSINGEDAILPVGNVVFVGRVERVARTRLVHLEVLVALLLLILVRVNTDLVVVVLISDCGINTNRPVLLVVDSADLKAVLVAADKARLLPAVPRGASTHHRRLHEDA